MPKGGFDFSELEEWVDKKLTPLQKEFNAWLFDFMYDIADRLIENIRKRTPVKTGYLRDQWRVESVAREGDKIVAWFRNDADYASYVEWGHAWPYWGGIAEEGDLQWINGRFMMRVSLKEAEDALPKKFETEFDKFLKRHKI